MTPEVIRRRNLPHWDVPHAAYFITTCLEGSIPARGFLDLHKYRDELRLRSCPENKTQGEWAVELWKRSFARTEHWMDREPAVPRPTHYNPPELLLTP